MLTATRRASGLAGLVLPPVTLGLVATATWLEWDYLHSLGWTFQDHGEVPYPSATGTGDWAAVTIVNFLVSGMLAAMVAAGLRREFRTRVSGAVASGALALLAASLFLLAAPTDIGSDTPVSWHGWLHGVGYLGLLLSMLVGFAATGLALRGNPDWRRWRLAVGGYPVLLLVALLTGFGLPGDTGWYAFLVLAFGWFGVVGFRLTQLAARGDHLPVPDAPSVERTR